MLEKTNPETSLLSKFSMTHYFPVTVFQIDVAGADALNRNLLDAIYAEQERDQKGIVRSSFEELGGWHSQNYLHRKAEYAGLVERISAASKQLSTELCLSTEHALKIDMMWSIINPPGGSNKAHVHPHSQWSGVYYIQAPAGSGDIEFIDPRIAYVMNQPKFRPDAKKPRECWTSVRYTPTSGRMLIFPSWVYHAVFPNMSQEKGRAGERIIISFNMTQAKI